MKLLLIQAPLPELLLPQMPLQPPTQSENKPRHIALPTD